MTRQLVLLACLAAAGCARRDAPLFTATDSIVVLTADRTVVDMLDGVAFTARVRRDAEPIGWEWVVDSGIGADPWTKPCEGTTTSCRISVHGSGTMKFRARINGQTCTGWVHIHALLLPDADISDTSHKVENAARLANWRPPSLPACVR